ncbi:hypothetical protein FEM48_Zijuj05G0020800 [Ziziphus jujuba var. spinosa]|uniref:Retrotransposon Copia-like N-terminal domain-containing protein n=1 Tax=Ziziphus jujuba var. spinosa TaxID=714518 RepID=A0A978VC65_ZIZJJ|nr:hypothetical protein FEM48_Zijuj05G0020800 [Ziziphus jujuba var. spinosa]
MIAPAIGFHVQDNSLITPERLDGTNYVEWSLNAQNKIRGRKRWGFISGTKAAPKDEHSEEYETRQDENCLVKSWLLDVMTNDIMSLFLQLGTAKEIWDALDDIDDCTMECTSDITKYTAKVNAQRVYVFLAGLHSHLDGVRGRILATIPLPNIQNVYAVVCAKANRQEAMLGSHTVDTCFRLHGYLDWHPKSKKASQFCSTVKEEDINLKVNAATISVFAAQSGDTALDDGNVELELQKDLLIDSTISPESPHQPH